MSDLEERLAAAATDPMRVPDFLSELLDAQVLVAGQIDPGTIGVEGGSTSATLAPLVRADGTSIQPFFTSETRLRETVHAVPGYESRYLAMRCRDLWEMTRGSTLVLNPHSAYGKEFLPGEIAQLLDGAAAMTTHVIAEPTKVLVGQPAHVPAGMEDALSDLFSKHAAIDSAYLGWKVTPDSGDQSYLLVICGSETASTELGDDLGRGLVPFSHAHPVDVMFATHRQDHLLTAIEPFYRRPARKRGLFRR